MHHRRASTRQVSTWYQFSGARFKIAGFQQGWFQHTCTYMYHPCNMGGCQHGRVSTCRASTWTPLGDSWWLGGVLRGSLCVLVVSGSSWSSLVVPCGSLVFLLVPSDCWGLLIVPCGSCWCLMFLGVFWWFLVALCVAWCVPGAFLVRSFWFLVVLVS